MFNGDVMSPATIKPTYIFMHNAPKILSDCKKKEPILNLMEIRPVGAALIRADRRKDGPTDIKKVTGPFHVYAKAPKIA